MDTFEDWIDGLRRTDCAIIVEGKKDAAALKHLGIDSEQLKGPLFQACEKISEKHECAIILTDLDKEGRKLYSRLKEGLARCGVRIDDSYREFLFKETELSQIEGLLRYLDSAL